MTGVPPDVISRYFQLDADRDVDAILGVFADDATVVDEAETRHGTDEIRAWLTDTAWKYTYATEVTESKPRCRSLPGHGPPNRQLPRRHRRP